MVKVQLIFMRLTLLNYNDRCVLCARLTHCAPLSIITPCLHFMHPVPFAPVLQAPFHADLLCQGFVLLLEATVEEDVASERRGHRFDWSEHQEDHCGERIKVEGLFFFQNW